MPAFTIIVIAVIAGLLLGTTLVIGAPYLAIPIVFVAIAIIGWGSFRQRTHGTRSSDALHAPARADAPIEFTERDRETLTPSPEAREKADGGG